MELCENKEYIPLRKNVLKRLIKPDQDVFLYQFFNKASSNPTVLFRFLENLIFPFFDKFGRTVERNQKTAPVQ